MLTSDRERVGSAADGPTTASGVMHRLKALHDAYDQGIMGFEEFDVAKTLLLERLAIGFATSISAPMRGVSSMCHTQFRWFVLGLGSDSARALHSLPRTA
jgi:hypothetical protein